MTKGEARKELRKLIKRGSIVYTNLRHVSPSGMMRHISCHIVNEGKIIDITFYVSEILDIKLDKKNHALRVSGAGMDMGFHVVYELSRSLFDKRFGYPDDPGYALKHQWI